MIKEKMYIKLFVSYLIKMYCKFFIGKKYVEGKLFELWL